VRSLCLYWQMETCPGDNLGNKEETVLGNYSKVKAMLPSTIILSIVHYKENINSITMTIFFSS